MGRAGQPALTTRVSPHHRPTPGRRYVMHRYATASTTPTQFASPQMIVALADLHLLAAIANLLTRRKK